MMYNRDLKFRFVQQRNKSRDDERLCYLIFRRTEQFEKKWGADICTKSVEDVQPVLELICGKTGDWSRLYILKDYCRWCLYDIKFPGAKDGILRAKVTGIDIIRKQMVASPLDLQRCLDKIYRPETEKTVDNVFRCFFWLAFCGVPEDEYFDVTSGDVNLVDMTIVHNNNEYALYRESFASVRNCATLSSFALIHPLHSDITIKPRGGGDRLLRGYGKSNSLNNIRSAISQSVKKQGGERTISYNRVWLSGVFYRIHEDEIVTGAPRFDGLLDDFMRGKEYKLGPGRTSPMTVRKEKLNLFKQSYDRWKLAFNY